MPNMIDLDDYRAELECIGAARQAWIDSFEALEQSQLGVEQMSEAMQVTQRAYHAYADRCAALTTTLIVKAGLMG